jgi:uncharacterized membrane protein
MNNHKKHPTFGEHVADKVAAMVGSWQFIIIQSCILIFWMWVNATGAFGFVWDKPPFILLNLFLSFQAAYTAPMIMMSQNRQNAIDRKRAVADYEINKKAELEIESIQQQLREISSKLDGRY